jgi:uncharacterized protein DUF3631/bifunctional DNA primase/polymerase-like protein/primase-like protein
VMPNTKSETNNSSQLERALRLVRAGHRVFPVAVVKVGDSIGKRPLVPSPGFHLASSDADQVRRWWSDHPEAAIGLAIPPGTVVVDVDSYKPNYRPDHGLHLPDTLMQSTIRGGWQMFYRTDGRTPPQMTAVHGNPIDTRAPGKGYVVAWEPEVIADAPISTWVPAPEWVYERRSRKSGIAIDNAPIPEGSRHDYYVSRAGDYARVGMPPDVVEAALLAESRRRSPDHDEADIRAIARSSADWTACTHTATPEGLAEYLDGLRAFLTRYVAFPSDHEPTAIALWIAHAWYVQQFDTSPLLAITSAEMRSGKTRTLELIELLVPNPFRVVTPSEAVTYTLLSERPRRTMLLDEADAIFGPRTAERYEGLRAILNSGNRQGSPVPRVKLDGKRREVDWFDVFGAKVLAGIGNLPDTVTDRAIPIRLKRRAPSETVARFRRRQVEAEVALFREGPPEVLLATDVPVPDELNDRAADSWEPLIAIAEAAGGSWPTVARIAAVALSSEDEAPASVGMRLLADIREALEGREHLSTADLLAALHDLEDAPWGDWYGKPLTARGLAKLLGPYRVLPVKRRLDGGQHRGYFAIDFRDAWERYVPSPATVPRVPGGPAHATLAFDGTDGAYGTGGMAPEDDYPPSAFDLS